jgi:hypothetical protein
MKTLSALVSAISGRGFKVTNVEQTGTHVQLTVTDAAGNVPWVAITLGKTGTVSDLPHVASYPCSAFQAALYGDEYAANPAIARKNERARQGLVVTMPAIVPAIVPDPFNDVAAA